MTTTGVETIEHAGTAYALIVRANAASSEKYNFLTNSQQPLQLGMNFYQRGDDIKAHYHLPRQIETRQIQEFVLIGSGRALLKLFDPADLSEVANRQLEAGDMVLLLAGGHSFEIQEDTKIIEVKQGPYDGKSKDKVVFGT
jgi:hypothetical protein